jgi:hypothetical protein
MFRRVFLTAGRTITTAAVLAFVVTVIPGSVAHAQATKPAASKTAASVNNGNGLRVSPVRNDVTIKPGTTQTVELYVQNITNSPAQLHAVINDFVASADESGKPRLLLNGESAPSHGLKQYVNKISDFSLQPQEQKILKATIVIPANAAGGGYFGAVRFLPTSVDSSKNVSLSASVASLVLVTVPGDVKEQVGIESFNITRGDNGKASNFFTNGKNLNAVIRFKNSGNLQEAPFGKILIKKSGNIVGTYEINNTSPRGSVLPDSIRRFTISLNNKNFGFGKYSVEGNFGYGNKGQLISTSSSFFVFPLPMLIAAIVIVLAIILAVVIFPRMLKSHDRKLIRKLRGRRK